MASGEAERVTAAVLIIGDEILSGRSQDTNLRDRVTPLTSTQQRPGEPSSRKSARLASP